MMTAGTMIVSLVALCGWLFLNYRALQAQNLSFQHKAVLALAWAVIIGGLAFVLSRSGY